MMFIVNCKFLSLSIASMMYVSHFCIIFGSYVCNILCMYGIVLYICVIVQMKRQENILNLESIIGKVKWLAE